jgi:hypothetical protein
MVIVRSQKTGNLSSEIPDGGDSTIGSRLDERPQRAFGLVKRQITLAEAALSRSFLGIMVEVVRRAEREWRGGG